MLSEFIMMTRAIMVTHNFRTQPPYAGPGFWEDAVVDNIDEEYDRLVRISSAKEAEGSRATKRGLSHETLELILQREAARASGNKQPTSELAKRCREAIKEDLKERRAAVLAKAAERKASAMPAVTSLTVGPR
ncbi:hypothetical protein ANCCAN_13524 [Ancylostoma caninum]|uniref:Uncharacterized protein n=1 Tax=Ancylostoma caninum TaxID=29170 RepID=A0A368G814_ANCCA|nr:hypothetical protein ANCCAN_13524 [Ancylostoma caninum]